MLYTITFPYHFLKYSSQALKVRTREVLYEKFRTEKLLAWRSTRRIDPVETNKILEGALKVKQILGC